jgi:hypothetical protein
MVSAGCANFGRIIGLSTQILRAVKGAERVPLLKALFNDNPLIFAGNCGNSPRPSRVEIG